MPEIARFLGIIIRMYVEAGQKHNSPHFHAFSRGLWQYTISKQSN